jgi:hypothetical protein
MQTLSLRTTSLVSGFVLGVALSPMAPARACEPLRCAPSVFLPVSGSVPSNALEFLWRPPFDNGEVNVDVGATVHLYKVENGQRSELATEVSAARAGYKLVRATEPVAAGSKLVLESVEPRCTIAAAVQVMVTVGASSPKPTQLGKLSVGKVDSAKKMNLPTDRGLCSDDYEVASAQLKLALDPAAQPFVDLMQHALIVDGNKRPQPQPTPPQGADPSFALGGKLEDELYTLCDKPSDSWTGDLTAGSHRVQWLATLPDGSELRSDEVMIDLRCAHLRAAATQASDAGLSANDAGLSANDEGAPLGESGDGCSLYARTSRGVPLTWLFALGVLLVRRNKP